MIDRRNFLSLSAASAATATLPLVKPNASPGPPHGIRVPPPPSPSGLAKERPAPGTFPARWIAGSPSCMDNTDPPLQLHWYNAHTLFLRENKAYSYEAPFLLLLFGTERVLLIDSGFTTRPGSLPLRQAVDDAIAAWCKAQRRATASLELLVVHTHLHTDHFAGQNQFVDRPRTRIMGLSHAEMVGFWGMTDFPNQTVKLDLGGREIWVWGNPGHVISEFAYYDTYTQILHTGDMFYRGRCYISYWDLWNRSMDRLVAFTEQHPVAHVVGCHVEMGKHGEDYPYGVTYQPDEAPWQLTVKDLRDTAAFAKTVKDNRIYFTGAVYLCNQTRGTTTIDTNPYLYP